MYKDYIHSHLLIIFLVISSLLEAEAQCNNKNFLNHCASALDQYNFQKAFKINKAILQRSDSLNRVQYEYKLKKNTRYKFVVCNGQPNNKLIVELYNQDHKLIKTNYKPKSEAYYSAIDFYCPSSGLYHITYYFEKKVPEKSKICGVGILGYQR